MLFFGVYSSGWCVFVGLIVISSNAGSVVCRSEEACVGLTVCM